MFLAGIKVADTPLVREAIEVARSSSEPYLFNHAMRSWLFGVLIAERSTRVSDPEILAVSVILHDLGLTDRYTGGYRFEIDGANAARSFLKERGVSAGQTQLVWDAIALHTTPSIALHKERKDRGMRGNKIPENFGPANYFFRNYFPRRVGQNDNRSIFIPKSQRPGRTREA